jgi:hypothetical protein
MHKAYTKPMGISNREFAGFAFGAFFAQPPLAKNIPQRHKGFKKLYGNWPFGYAGKSLFSFRVNTPRLAAI